MTVAELFMMVVEARVLKDRLQKLYERAQEAGLVESAKYADVACVGAEKTLHHLAEETEVMIANAFPGPGEDEMIRAVRVIAGG